MQTAGNMFDFDVLAPDNTEDITVIASVVS